jgi:hypothetical protein
MIYLSGPMTGLPDYNYPAFREAARTLRSYGQIVFDPSEAFEGKTDLPKEVYMRKDIEALLKADVVALLPGWNTSSGAQLEVEVAKQCGIPIRLLEELLATEGVFLDD